MSRPWSAERTVWEALARELIEEQFPQLAPPRIDPFGIGWDNSVFLVNGEWVFRFPRRQFGVDCMEAELRVLPAIASRLPIAVSVSSLVGRPSSRFPWPFAAYRKIPGETACRLSLDEIERHDLAEPLGRFLRALHAIPREEAERAGAGHDRIGKLDLKQRLPAARRELDLIQDLGRFEDMAALRAVLVKTADRFSGGCPRGRPVLLHGDLYARHLLVGDDARLSGVIDWGDIHLGNAAVDLSIAHAFLPPAARARFRHAYGPIDDDTWQLARFRALCHSTVVVTYAYAIGDQDLLREGLRSLAHLATDAHGSKVDP
ncbi:MAG: phosphotransferase [Planctomycetota bacterium]